METSKLFQKGARVIYIPNHAEEDARHPDSQHGVVSSIKGDTVFVKYDNAMMKMVTGDEPYTAQGTPVRNLVPEFFTSDAAEALWNLKRSL